MCANKRRAQKKLIVIRDLFFRLKLTFSCMMDLSKFPLDNQICTMEVASCKCCNHSNFRSKNGKKCHRSRSRPIIRTVMSRKIRFNCHRENPYIGPVNSPDLFPAKGRWFSRRAIVSDNYRDRVKNKITFFLRVRPAAVYPLFLFQHYVYRMWNPLNEHFCEH